jgi:hypothetical protein
MPYNKTNWLDRAVQYPNRFTMVTNADGTITLTPSPGTVSQAGTPISASALNNLETQYDDAYADAQAYVATYAAPLFSQAIYTGSKGKFSGYNIQICQVPFFTNGNSNSAQYSYSFSTAFKSLPTIFPADITVAQSYGDTILYPFIFNKSLSGFSVKILTAGGQNFGTSGSPANLFMNFIALGIV